MVFVIRSACQVRQYVSKVYGRDYELEKYGSASYHSTIDGVGIGKVQRGRGARPESSGSVASPHMLVWYVRGPGGDDGQGTAGR